MRPIVGLLLTASALVGCGSSGNDVATDPSGPVTVQSPPAAATSATSATSVTSAAEIPAGPATIVYETSAGVIETPEHGPEIAFGFLESYPPQGGGLPLANWNWDTAPDSESASGTTWGGSYRIVGTWDGAVFTLTEVPTTTREPAFDREYGQPTEDCLVDDFRPVLEFTGTLDRDALGIVGSGDDVWDGRCGAYIEATFDTPELRAAIAPMADRIITSFWFRPVGEEPPAPLPTLERLDTLQTLPSTTSSTTPL